MRVARGAISVLMGLSGSGKSTLLRAVNGLNPVVRGKVRVRGKDGSMVDVVACPPTELRALRRGGVSMVFQQFALLPWRVDTVLLSAFPIPSLLAQAVLFSAFPLLSLRVQTMLLGSFPLLSLNSRSLRIDAGLFRLLHNRSLRRNTCLIRLGGPLSALFLLLLILPCLWRRLDYRGSHTDEQYTCQRIND